jgi:glyoxylase-like metal-dependent hydrolase (beta-lactamase superfamily II)
MSTHPETKGAFKITTREDAQRQGHGTRLLDEAKKQGFDIEGNIFSGDTLLAPDIGTARCDFPGGSAETLYKSVRRILENYPGDTKIYLCHDYGEEKNRDNNYLTTIGEQRKNNVQIRDGITLEDYIKFRTDRDKKLDLPTYIFPSVQINGNGGDLVPGEFIKLTYNKKVL